MLKSSVSGKLVSSDCCGPSEIASSDLRDSKKVLPVAVSATGWPDASRIRTSNPDPEFHFSTAEGELPSFNKVSVTLPCATFEAFSSSPPNGLPANWPRAPIFGESIPLHRQRGLCRLWLGTLITVFADN